MEQEIKKLLHYCPSINPEIFSDMEFEKVEFLIKNFNGMNKIVEELWWILCEYKSHRNFLASNLNKSIKNAFEFHNHQINFQRYLMMMSREVAIQLNEYRVLLFDANSELINSSSKISNIATKKLRQIYLSEFKKSFPRIRELRNSLCHPHEFSSSRAKFDSHISLDALVNLGLSSELGVSTFVGCIVYPGEKSFGFYATVSGNVVGLEFSENTIKTLFEITKGYYSIFYGLERDGMARVQTRSEPEGHGGSETYG